MTDMGTPMDTSERKIGEREAHATRAFFFIGGFGAASWAPLVPLLRERLAIGDDVLGLLLLCIGIGSLLTMPLSGALSARLGCRRVLTIAGVLYAATLLAICLIDSLWIAVPIILLFGALMGCLDVVINVAAVIVEKGIGRRIMSGMHGFWSLGGFVGAGLYGVWVGLVGLTAQALDDQRAVEGLVRHRADVAPQRLGAGRLGREPPLVSRLCSPPRLLSC